MNRETIRDYLHRTAMDEAQAGALSRIFAEMATKSDLLVLEEKVDKRMSVLEEKLAGQMAHLKADLTWRMIAIVGFFGTVITLFNSFYRLNQVDVWKQRSDAAHLANSSWSRGRSVRKTSRRA